MPELLYVQYPTAVSPEERENGEAAQRIRVPQLQIQFSNSQPRSIDKTLEQCLPLLGERVGVRVGMV
jgi:hypothetical protein